MTWIVFVALFKVPVTSTFCSANGAGFFRPVGRTLAERIKALAGIMRELGYESVPVDSPKEKLPAIEATNCVFHSLAQRYPEVCHFDLAMMSKVVGRDVIHDECMVRGGHVCRFKFKERG